MLLAPPGALEGGCSEGFRSSIAFEELGCAIVVDARPFTSRRDVVICGLMCRSVYKSFALRFLGAKRVGGIFDRRFCVLG